MRSKVKQGRIPKFKERFKEIVESFGGQSVFAERSGISRQTIGFWYNGDRVPNAEMLIELSRFCNVSVDYLLGLTDAKTALQTDKEKALRVTCDYTGLSEKAVEILHKSKIRADFVSYMIGCAAVYTEENLHGQM